MGHFFAKKIEHVLIDHFFRPKMRHDVERYVLHCATCHKAKSFLTLIVYTLYLFLALLVKIFQWTLFLVYLKQRGGGTPFLLLLIDLTR